MLSIQHPHRSLRHTDAKPQRSIILGIVAMFACTGWYWFFFFSGFWDISALELKNIKTLDRVEVHNEIQRILQEQPWRPWHRQNIFMLHTDAIAQNLRGRLFIDNVFITKKYPNTLELQFNEKQRSVIIVSHDVFVNVDANGIVTGEPDKEALAVAQACLEGRSIADEHHLPVIELATEDPVSTGFQIAKTEQVRRWLDVAHQLILGGVKFRYIKLEDSNASYARFVSEKGYDIYFDLLQPIEPQLYTYLEYMKTKPDQKKITEYIDVRVPGKVYIK